MADERRRWTDALEVKIDNLVEAIAELKKDIKDLDATHSKRFTDIEEEIWGFPKGKGLGLLQKVRDSNQRWTYVWAACVFLFAALGRIASPLYDKFVSDWVYNSPSQRWMRESRKPKVRVYKIYQQPEQVPAVEGGPGGK